VGVFEFEFDLVVSHFEMRWNSSNAISIQLAWWQTQIVFVANLPTFSLYVQAGRAIVVAPEARHASISSQTSTEWGEWMAQNSNAFCGYIYFLTSERSKELQNKHLDNNGCMVDFKKSLTHTWIHHRIAKMQRKYM
jgi:hypothetical protein